MRLTHAAALRTAGRRIAADRASRTSFRRALRGDESTEPLPVSIRQLGGGEVWLRPGTTDTVVAMAAFAAGRELPPEGMEPSLIWDLGCNIGLTMRRMGHLFPQARIVGVELDAENAALARRNLQPLATHCEVIEAAVWPVSGQVSYAREGGADAYRVSGSGGIAVETVTPEQMLERHGVPDYVKVDIEGAEQALLEAAAGWAKQVAAISVECHPPYSLWECRQDLEGLGFVVSEFPRTLRRLNRDYAVGVRPA